LWVACTLVIAERIGKAVRSPAKDTLLSHAAAVTGRGRGFAVHEALDQIGAIIGPLTVASMLAVTGDDYGPALGVLAIPGVAALALLVWLLLRVPEPARYESAKAEPVPTPTSVAADARRRRPAPLPARFWTYCAFTATTMIGFTTFGVLSFHMVTDGILSVAAVPLIYAAAMGADAVAALGSGWAYDRIGAKTLAALPILSALVPVVAFSNHVWLVVAGALWWGAAVGIQESTLRAVVADLVAPPRRATAYGVFAAGLGAATAAGGALTGWLYDKSIPALIATVVVVQIAAVGVATAAWLLRRRSARVERAQR
jgi:MFS family permease